MYTWGCNKYGQLGDGLNLDSFTPTMIFEESEKITQISCGWAHTLVLSSELKFRVCCYSSNRYGHCIFFWVGIVPSTRYRINGRSKFTLHCGYHGLKNYCNKRRRMAFYLPWWIRKSLQFWMEWIRSIGCRGLYNSITPFADINSRHVCGESILWKQTLPSPHKIWKPLYYRENKVRRFYRA